jgi:serpin B
MAGLTACNADSTQTQMPTTPSEPVVTIEPAPDAPGQARELDMETAAMQANHFARRFYDEVASEETGNLFFSPLSIHAALSMTYAGARRETAEQMKEVLAFQFPPEEGIEHHAYSMLLKALNDAPITRFESYDEGEPETIVRPVFELVVANRLWGQEGFSWDPGFVALTEREYLAGLAEVDYTSDAEGARATINEWVEETTRDRIENLIPEGALDAVTRLVLTNAIYFKANWQNAFSEHSTKPEPFHLENGDAAEVPTMHLSEKLQYAETENWQALEMPYEEGALSMLVFLPVDRDGAMEATEQELASGALLQALESAGRPKVEVSLPKFRLEQHLDLGDTLKAMGMPLAFSDQADFSGMTTEASLLISKALHKAFVEVDEKGTEAAAATAIVMSLTSAPQPEQAKVFRADRPFIFMIRHNASGAILFMGRVTDPR